MEATVLGAGSWGTALAILLARNGHAVKLHGRDREQIAQIADARENLRYLPGFAIPDEVMPVADDSELTPTDLWVIAVPSGGVRETLRLIKGKKPLIAMASKGLEPENSIRLSEIVTETRPDATVVTLSGPNLAVEIGRGIPTAAVSASGDTDAAERVRGAFMCRAFRIYLSQDVAGVELAGALKNVLAIGAGMSDGLGFGDNTKGAFLARGLREMTALGIAMGGKLESFIGIAGVGDLFATAASKLSRNYRVGRAIGERRTLEEALDEIGQVAEGVPTAHAAVSLAKKHSVEMPAFEAVNAVLIGKLKPIDAVSMLMERMPKSEEPLPA
jgi:glycerol-3-phosphate dehydrogenase (NAD(P)+)